MAEYVRVRWKATGHQSSIPIHRFDAERHTNLKRPAVDRNGEPLPPKYKTPVSPKAADETDTTGHQANTPEGEV